MAPAARTPHPAEKPAAPGAAPGADAVPAADAAESRNAGRRPAPGSGGDQAGHLRQEPSTDQSLYCE